MKHILLSFLLGSLCFAQENKPDATATEKAKQELLGTLFSSLTSPEFDKAIAQARKTGINPQVILEARFLHLVDQGNNAALAKLSNEMDQWRDKFDPQVSEVFGVKEDWLSVINYTQALAALENKNHEDFKKHITEAYWLSPRHAQIYGPHIERLRLNEAMANLTLKSDLTVTPQQGGAPVSLGSLMKGKKAVVLHFWSPMSQEVQVNMPDFTLTSAECLKHGIGVISVLIGSTPDTLKDAEEIRKENQEVAKCSWVIDSNKGYLTTQLRIVDIPTMVIISSDGKILFNGHPSEKEFWQKIQQLAPDFKRPNNAEHKHADD